MECYRGFLTTKSEKTKKEVPFFVKTRQEDIVSGQIPLTFKQTSGLYDPKYHPNEKYQSYTAEPVIYCGTDYTSYTFDTLIITDDDNASTYSDGEPRQSVLVTSGSGSETRYNTWYCSKIVYKLYRDKTFSISGTCTLHFGEDSSPYENKVTASIILPYACPSSFHTLNVFRENYYPMNQSDIPIVFQPSLIEHPDLSDGNRYLYKIIFKNMKDYSTSCEFGFLITGTY